MSGMFLFTHFESFKLKMIDDLRSVGLSQNIVPPSNRNPNTILNHVQAWLPYPPFACISRRVPPPTCRSSGSTRYPIVKPGTPTQPAHLHPLVCQAACLLWVPFSPICPAFRHATAKTSIYAFRLARCGLRSTSAFRGVLIAIKPLVNSRN